MPEGGSELEREAAASRGDRGEALARLKQLLAPTELGRGLRLDRLVTLEDLRASVPVRDPAAHLREVEGGLGFGPDSERSGLSASLRAPEERARLAAGWRGELERASVYEAVAAGRIAVVVARAQDYAAAERVADLRVAGFPRVELLDEERLGSHPQGWLAALQAFAPTGLVVPSLALVAELERVSRGAIEHAIPSLRALWSEHEHDLALRSRLVRLSSGPMHRAGAWAIPVARRGPLDGPFVPLLSCAWDSLIVELLPEPRAEGPRRRSRAKRLTTRWPEAALCGERYELVLSSAAGYLRLRSGRHVRVVGFESVREGSTRRRPRPLFVEIPAPPPPLRLEGVTLDGASLTACVRQAFTAEDPALIEAEVRGAGRASLRGGPDPRAGFFDETELGALEGARAQVERRERARAKAIELRVEVQGRAREAFGERLGERFDGLLRARSPSYDYLRREGGLEAPRVAVVDGGSARRRTLSRLLVTEAAVYGPLVRVAVR